jgi:hypothetical protein
MAEDIVKIDGSDDRADETIGTKSVPMPKPGTPEWEALREAVANHEYAATISALVVSPHLLDLGSVFHLAITLPPARFAELMRAVTTFYMEGDYRPFATEH